MKRKNNFIANIANILLIVFLIGALCSMLDIDFLKRKDEGPVRNEEQTKETRIAVPNTGYVNRVYFDTDLTDEEIVSILSVITTYNDSEDKIYTFFKSDSFMLNVMKISDNEYSIYNQLDFTIYYHNCVEYESQMGFIGWNQSVSSFIVINSINTTDSNENNKLIDLIYTYPSELIKEEVTTLGTPVPTSGMVENVYFNTSLSVDEVVSILDTYKISDVNGIYSFLINDDASVAIIAIYDNPYDAKPDINCWRIVMLVNGEQNLLFSEISSVDDGVDFIGWNPEINYPLSINTNVVEVDSVGMLTEFNISSSGYDNNKLSNLVSTTPFN